MTKKHETYKEFKESINRLFLFLDVLLLAVASVSIYFTIQFNTFEAMLSTMIFLFFALAITMPLNGIYFNTMMLKKLREIELKNKIEKDAWNLQHSYG